MNSSPCRHFTSCVKRKGCEISWPHTEELSVSRASGNNNSTAVCCWGLCARGGCEGLTLIVSFTPCSNSLKWVLLLSPPYDRWGNWGSEKGSKLVPNDRAREGRSWTQIQTVRLQRLLWTLPPTSGAHIVIWFFPFVSSPFGHFRAIQLDSVTSKRKGCTKAQASIWGEVFGKDVLKTKMMVVIWSCCCPGTRCSFGKPHKACSLGLWEHILQFSYWLVGFPTTGSEGPLACLFCFRTHQRGGG